MSLATSARSAPSATRALTENLSGPTSTVATGLASRLWNQWGLWGDALLEAITAKRSPYGRHPITTVRSENDFAPVVVRSMGLLPAIGPLNNWPPLARNSSINFALK